VESLRERVIIGIGWTTLNRISQQGLKFAISVLLARLLTPEAFGLVGMIVVFTGFASLFADAGFGAALVQREEIEERHLSSVFWLQAGLGILLTLMLAAIAPLVAQFYGEPVLEVLTMFVAIQFTIESLGTVQTALFRRKMDFKKITIVKLVATVVSGGVAIVLALLDYGVWSLVWQTVLNTTADVAAVWILSSWYPQFLFRRSAIRELLSYSGNLLGFNAINYWTRNSDDLLIGRYVGSAGLGIYNRAYETMMLPIYLIRGIIGEVMFPTLSRLQKDVDHVRRVYLRATRTIGFISIPMMCGLMVVAESFVLALFGPKWEAVVPVLRVLCLIGIKQPVSSTTGWIFKSQGRTDQMFYWNLVVSTATVLSFIVGVQWGVLGVAIAFTIRGYLLHYHGIVIPGRLIDLSFGKFHWNLAGIAGCSFAMMGLVSGLGTLLPPTWGHWLRLLVQVPFGMIVYWGLAHGFGLQAYHEALDLLLKEWEKRVQPDSEE
jgi:PST family polysaccharide transporter